MPDARPVLITANPYSGKGSNPERVEALSQALDRLEIDSETVWSLPDRRARLGDPAVQEKYRCLVSAGGDGSIAAALNDLRAGGDSARLPIAMLPVGTENLFAIEFQHDRGPQALAQLIAAGHTRTVDAGDADGRLFTLMTSLGFDSEVVRRVNAWRTPAQAGQPLKRVSRLSYAPRVVGALAGYRYPRITLEADGRMYTGAHAFVFNIGQYGGGLKIAKKADPGDARLDWVLFERPGPLALAGYGLSVVRGKHLARDDVRCGRATRIRLSCSRADGLSLQADGDPAGVTPAQIRVLPGALRVVTAP